jgi:hypothetical protein
VVKKAKKRKKVVEVDIRDIRRHALRVERELFREARRWKRLLTSIKAKVQDSKLTVNVNRKGEIEIEFCIKALVKRK